MAIKGTLLLLLLRMFSEIQGIFHLFVLLAQGEIHWPFRRYNVAWVTCPCTEAVGAGGFDAEGYASCFDSRCELVPCFVGSWIGPGVGSFGTGSSTEEELVVWGNIFGSASVPVLFENPHADPESVSQHLDCCHLALYCTDLSMVSGWS